MKTFWLEDEKAYIRYFDTQHGERPLVFIHGLGSSSIADFSDIINDRRFDKFRSILVDLPGHGFSDRPQYFGYSLYDHAKVIEKLIEQLDLRGVTVVGHSLGGTIAIALAQVREDLLSHLILVEPNFDPGVGSGSKIIASQQEQAYISKGHRLYQMFLQKGIRNSPGDAIYYGTFAISDPLAIHRSAVGLLAGTNPPQREVIAGLKIPKSLIIGEKNINEFPHDPLLGLGLRIFTVKDAGHAMMNDKPIEFRNLLLDILD
jgi:pimeloyl-ACP methyl ester carboxylesterase